jgi:DNA-binding MarR family transcriptional regulator
LLREVARLYTRAERVVSDCCHTTSTQGHILGELARGGAMPMGELGGRLLLEKSWVCRAVDGLVQLGLVAKQPNPDDARSWLVGLTGAGHERVEALKARLDEHAAQLLAPIAHAQRTQIDHALGLLLHALRGDPSATCCLPAAQRRPAPAYPPACPPAPAERAASALSRQA